MTIKEFALLAGVSVSTVSKIMNGKDASIRARTREHVLKLAKEYNYVPYASAAAPTTRTLTMGVIFQNTEHGKRLVSSILKEATSLLMFCTAAVRKHCSRMFAIPSMRA